MLEENVIAKFNKCVIKGDKPNDCWGWIGTTTVEGTPNILLWKKSLSGRRVSLILSGKDPGNSLVKSLCGNKLCLNPEHLVFDIEIKFWSKVNKGKPDECWNWNGTTDKGYGVFCCKGSKIGAHVFSHQINNGPVPKGKCVCHSCDNPSCVNPNHLWLGTDAENVADRDTKGRTAKGKKTSNPRKLTENQVREIRDLGKSGVSKAKISRQFKVHVSTIKKILSGDSWSWLT